MTFRALPIAWSQSWYCLPCLGAWTALRDSNQSCCIPCHTISHYAHQVTTRSGSWIKALHARILQLEVLICVHMQAVLRLSSCALCVVPAPNSSSWMFAPPLQRSIWQASRPTTHRSPNASPHCATPYPPCVSSCVASYTPHFSTILARALQIHAGLVGRHRSSTSAAHIDRLDHRRSFALTFLDYLPSKATR
jgi:hypothetical protein